MLVQPIDFVCARLRCVGPPYPLCTSRPLGAGAGKAPAAVRVGRGLQHDLNLPDASDPGSASQCCCASFCLIFAA